MSGPTGVKSFILSGIQTPSTVISALNVLDYYSCIVSVKRHGCEHPISTFHRDCQPEKPFMEWKPWPPIPEMRINVMKKYQNKHTDKYSKNNADKSTSPAA